MTTLSLARSWLGQARQRFWRLAPADAGSVVLRHSRIYILPTARGWALIGTLLVMLVTSTNYALSLGYGFTFLAAGLVSSALLHRPILHELLITLFIAITAPVTAVMLMRAAAYRSKVVVTRE